MSCIIWNFQPEFSVSVSADVVGDTKTVLAALSYKVVIPTTDLVSNWFIHLMEYYSKFENSYRLILDTDSVKLDKRQSDIYPVMSCSKSFLGAGQSASQRAMRISHLSLSAHLK